MSPNPLAHPMSSRRETVPPAGGEDVGGRKRNPIEKGGIKDFIRPQEEGPSPSPRQKKQDQGLG